MSAKVFISSGQRDHELPFVTEVENWLRHEGYDPFLALAAQTMQDVDSGVIDALRLADYFLFIDFKRKVAGSGEHFRGSLYAHQELALAYAFGIKECIYLQEEGLTTEGIGRFLMGKPEKFSERSRILSLVQELVKKRKWQQDYSRHLVVCGPCKGDPYDYVEKSVLYDTGRKDMHIQGWDLRIVNRRPHEAAHFSVAEFVGYTDPQGIFHKSRDTSAIKWGGGEEYEKTIFPNGGHASIDILSGDRQNWGNYYLHSKADTTPKLAIIRDARGCYLLHYRLCAFGFDPVRIVLKLTATNNLDTTQLTLESVSV
ncbi:hypothetical protein ACFL09_05585 [Planctomycetota bacterium]